MLLKEYYGIFDMQERGLIPTEWEDTAWGNDAMYSFEHGDLRIYIDVEDSIHEKSELFGDIDPSKYQRFHVCPSDKYREENPDDYYNDSWLFESNDWTSVVIFVQNNCGIDN